MLSAGAAFSLAFQPSSLVTQLTKRALTERVATTAAGASLTHAVEFARKALAIEDRLVAAAVDKLAAHARKGGVELPPAPTELGGVAAWLAGITAAARPALPADLGAVAFAAGEAARDLLVAVGTAAHVTYLRTAAPDDVELQAAAAAQAAGFATAAQRLDAEASRAGRPMVTRIAGSVRDLVRVAPDLAGARTDERFKAINEWARTLTSVVEAFGRAFDAPAPAQASAPPTAREQALLESILANPDYDPPRLELADLAAARNDPRAELIRAQFAARDLRAAGRRADEVPHLSRARQLITAHPEWTAPLAELGARDVRFERGFPEQVTISAADFLARGEELLLRAPITMVRLRDAAGQVARLATAPVLYRLAGLELAEQGVTDDDVAALAAAPGAARLRQLDLRGNRITDRGIEALAASPYLKQLETVNLDANPGADPVDALEYHDETHQHRVPTAAGRALEARYGRLRWLHPED